jgi:NAD(P)-dependent dehydrogenase (short-subunit alcohol dehydrogenase family)
MRTYIVSGGNAGIGKAIAVSLAKMQLHVVIISRDEQKGSSALHSIKDQSQSQSVELVVGNLDNIANTKQLAKTLKERFPNIAVLINNAGVWKTECLLNADGLETSFMVNHVAPFILSNLLLDILRKNTPARVVNVNAALYINGNLDLEKTPYGRDFSRLKTYMNTKLCNMLFTREFAKRIAGTGVTVNAVHPGVIRTDLGISADFLGAILNLMKQFLPSPEEGAKAPVWLATSPDVDGLSGKYFDRKVERPFARNALNDELAEHLWTFSAEICGI